MTDALTNDQMLARINGNDMAFPVENLEHTPNNTLQRGLTKREYFAAMAMRCINGMALDHANQPNVEYYKRAAACAVVAADELLSALDRLGEKR